MSHDNGPWDESLESMRVRLRLGAWVILLCIALFAVSDFREPPSVRAQLQFLRIVQFSAIALALYLNSRTTSRHVLLAMGVAFISMVCVTSALAGCFRGDPRTQVVTDLALTLATSATLPWGALPQMICVLVAGASMLLGVWWTYGTLAAMTAHTVVGVTAAFIASIYIAYQFQQYRQARDVAEAELAEARDQALTSARAKTIFLANMSHEIRTPMNVIIGMTDMALDADLPAEPREYLRRVRASATSLLGIINDVLDYSKMEDGKLTLHVIDMSLRATIDDVVALFTPSAEAKHLVLASIVADELPASVVGDPGRLRQVLTNLVGNALKFTETGSVTIEVSVVDPVARRVTVRIAVRDTGIGIPLDQQVSMFERFTQVDTATTSPYGGTGLGLTICRELVTLMGGQMAIESTPDVGTTIWFDVAFELGASELEARVERSYAPGKRPSSRRIVAESK
jgi:signal transduction histidine kinase